jgi:hypothetical protein
MNATAVELADLIAADLNNPEVQETLGSDYAFECERSYLPEVKREDAVKQLFVFTIPRSATMTNGSRNSTVWQPTVEVGVLCNPPATAFTDAWVDGLAAMVENIAARILRTAYAMANGSEARCVSVEVPVVYDYANLREGGAFKAAVICHFRKEE